MMSANHGAVDHLQRIRHDPALVQRLQDLFPQPRQRPAPELPIDRRPFAELFRQVASGRPRSGDPENPIQNKPMVRGLAAVRRTDSQDEAFKERPLVVRHQVSCHAGLHCRYQLESRSPRPVNPFCQHALKASQNRSQSNLHHNMLRSDGTEPPCRGDKIDSSNWTGNLVT